MVEFLKVAAPLMMVVSTLIVSARLFPSFRASKAFHFTCSVSSFITAIAYGGLAVLGVSSSAPFLFGLWFIIGSLKFAYATFWVTD